MSELDDVNIRSPAGTFDFYVDFHFTHLTFFIDAHLSWAELTLGQHTQMGHYPCLIDQWLNK